MRSHTLEGSLSSVFDLEFSPLNTRLEETLCGAALCGAAFIQGAVAPLFLLTLTPFQLSTPFHFIYLFFKTQKLGMNS